mgnify:CR=1 FL=1
MFNSKYMATMDEYIKSLTTDEEATDDIWSKKVFDAASYEQIVKDSFDVIEQAFVDYM